jgi:hypothetical protein
MKAAGGSLLVLGIILLLVALGMETSVSTYVPSTSIYSPSIPESVNNIGLLQKQMMTFQAGLAAILAGATFLAAGFVVEAINPPPKEAPQPLPTFEAPPRNAELQVERTPEELAAEERQMWIWVGATVAVAVGFMLLMAFFSARIGTPDAAMTNYSDEALMGNSVDSMINEAEIDAPGNVH